MCVGQGTRSFEEEGGKGKRDEAIHAELSSSFFLGHLSCLFVGEGERREGGVKWLFCSPSLSSCVVTVASVLFRARGVGSPDSFLCVEFLFRARVVRE